ncbi:hypothetical protein PLICRDRAFT_57608 [Plicaturopsis crispa FD-325 SS-3]|uniref:Uncharacterized protein n=1 Tax=Plicaturopsis crispa FD-325 SS-3 TaxID=944288 RepID=A0A0C9SXW0_PLICR|nr:hypothetical protein PLICRDRAFT_57608 [Plicaturopsis crispa FD-325 SS-3]
MTLKPVRLVLGLLALTTSSVNAIAKARRTTFFMDDLALLHMLQLGWHSYQRSCQNLAGYLLIASPISSVL